MEPVVAVVVAAGAGVRLGGTEPKALRLLNGRPLISHCLAGLAAGGVDQAVVVVAAGAQGGFEAALADSPIPAGYVFGGDDRAASVEAGLAAIAGDRELDKCRHVLVHDAARALVPGAVVAGVIAALRAGARGCVPVVPVVDTVRQLTPDGSVVMDRSQLRLVQTPQGFERAVLVDALRQARLSGLQITDDASAVAVLGVPIALVDGSRDALKVTEPLDLVMAEAIERSRR
jgi:2-C-methyl-D-erythritol 4-phosphate cytidylyltransferase